MQTEPLLPSDSTSSPQYRRFLCVAVNRQRGTRTAAAFPQPGNQDGQAHLGPGIRRDFDE